MYPTLTASILQYMGYRTPEDFEVFADENGTTLIWHHPDPKPTPEQVAAQELPWRKSTKAQALAAELKPYFESQWTEVERFTAENPAVSNDEFMAVYGAHRLACSQAVAAAIDAVKADSTNTVEAVNGVTIAWPATPEKPQ